MKKILIIEDDPEINRNIRDALTAEKMLVESVYNGLLAEKILSKKKFDCIILDINLSGKTGYEISKDFRKYNTSTPILMLSAFGELDDKVQGYELGADDYLTKLFYMRELIMRVNSLIKRSRLPPSLDNENTELVAGDLVLQTATKKKPDKVWIFL